MCPFCHKHKSHEYGCNKNHSLTVFGWCGRTHVYVWLHICTSWEGLSIIAEGTVSMSRKPIIVQKSLYEIGRIYIILKYESGDQRVLLVVKSTCCSSWGPEFSSHHQYGGLWSCVNPVPNIRWLLSDLWKHEVCMWWIYMKAKTQTHNNIR